MLELVLARHEVEAAISIMKKSWWPVITVVVALGFQHDLELLLKPNGECEGPGTRQAFFASERTLSG
jgi:hypothetical protein